LSTSPSRPSWTFLTSHCIVFIEVARRPDATVREVAAVAGITERQAHRILADLIDDGYVHRERVGRRNRYRVEKRRPIGHPSDPGRAVGELLAALNGTRPRRSAP
jgi:predicted HTH transcriptional regulator